MPGTANMTVGMLGRTPIVARVGGGFYVAYATGYPSLNRVKVWKVGATGTTEIAKTVGNNTSTTIAAAPDGRLWVAWVKRVGFVLPRLRAPLEQGGDDVGRGRRRRAAPPSPACTTWTGTRPRRRSTCS